MIKNVLYLPLIAVGILLTPVAYVWLIFQAGWVMAIDLVHVGMRDD